MFSKVVFWSALQTACLSSMASAQSGEVQNGTALARRWCANCHAVGTDDQRSANDAAPPFQEVARIPSTTSMSLRAFLQTPHANMPDYRLTRRELEEIASYILSLR